MTDNPDDIVSEWQNDVTNIQWLLQGGGAPVRGSCLRRLMYGEVEELGETKSQTRVPRVGVSYCSAVTVQTSVLQSYGQS